MNKILVLTLAVFIATAIISCVNCANKEENNDLIITATTTLAETTTQTETVPQTVLTTPEDTIIIEKDITFSYEYISAKDVMPYGLFTPSTVDGNKKTPLIVWLHGSGERDVGKATFINRGLPNVLNTWTLKGFDAYVLCPQLKGKWNCDTWCCSESKEHLQTLIDKFISEHNIDTEKIIIAGHSLGAQGALYMAYKLPDYFSKLAVFSGYQTYVDISEINIPTIGYVGMVRYGEAEASFEYMTGNFKSAFGEENTFCLPTSHGRLPYVAFNEDKDNNGHSDVIEWMLRD